MSYAVEIYFLFYCKDRKVTQRYIKNFAIFAETFAPFAVHCYDAEIPNA